MQSPSPTWKVTDQIPGPGVDADGVPGEGVTVIYQRADGTMGRVFVLNQNYRSDKVRAAILAHYNTAADIAGMTG